MSDTEHITRAVRTRDGLLLIEQPDGSFRPAEGQTDWRRIDGMSDDDIAVTTAGDDDAPDRIGDLWDQAQPIYPAAKERVTMRLDADMVDWFRRQGRGYQTKINAILRGYFEHERGGKER